MNDFKCDSSYSNETSVKYLNDLCVNEKPNVNMTTENWGLQSFGPYDWAWYCNIRVIFMER